MQSIETETNRITTLNVCETKIVIAGLPEHTHTNFCDLLEKITLLCVAGVTTIQERASLRRKQWRAIFKNNIWPEMPFKTHRLIPTREKEIEVLLEIPLRQHAVTATAPGLHPPLGTIAEDPRSFGSRPDVQRLERSRKRSQTL